MLSALVSMPPVPAQEVAPQAVEEGQAVWADPARPPEQPEQPGPADRTDAPTEGLVSMAPVISSVEMRSELPLARVQALRGLLAFEPGDRLTEGAVRRSVRELLASGEVAEVAIYSRPDPAGDGQVVAVVALWPHLIVSDVVLEGSLELPEERLRSRLVQRAGDPLLEGRVLKGIYRLEEQHREAGYLDARVQVQVRPGEGPQGVVVAYRVVPGPRTLVGEIEWVGDLGTFSASELEEQLRAGPGEPYDSRRLAEDPRRLRRYLVEQGYRQVRVEAPRTNLRDGVVDLAYTLDLGRPVTVEVHGAEREKLERKGLLPFLDEDGYDQALLIRTRDRLRNHYQENGHYRVAVEAQEKPSEESRLETEEEPLVVVVKIDPGPVMVLEELELDGNRSFADGRLSDLMATQPRRRLLPGSGYLVDDVLEEDLDNLRSFYALEGFWQAEVGEPAIFQELEPGAEKGTLKVTVPIEEGPRRLVASVQRSGVEQLPESALPPAPPLEEGGPFHPLRVEEAVEQLRLAYQGAGFEWVQITPRLDWLDETLVDVTLEVLEGPRMLLDRLVLRGNQKTDSDILRRFIDLEPGSPVSRQQLLEVQRDLSRLGVFSRVDVRLLPGEVGGSDRDVVVRVEEGTARRVSYGLGYDSDDGIRGLLGYSHRNLFGRALALQMDTRLSERDQLYRVSLQQPYLLRWDIPVTYSLFSFFEDRQSFDQDSRGLRIEGYRLLSRRRWGLVADLRTIDLENVEGSLDRIERQDREIEITSLIPSLLLDHRDDPFDPTEGWSTTLQLQYAFPAFSTDAHFLKLFVQQTHYLPLGRAGVVAASLRMGAIEPVGDELGPVPLSEDQVDNPVPIGERFFLGGRTTHRSFDRDLLGITGVTRIADPTDDGGVELLPVGGNGLLLANLEYRFPILGALGGTVFADVGNVWRDWRDVDPEQLRYGLGVGMRYSSPIGPVRLEVGFNFDQEPGEDRVEVHLTFGNPF
jgi:outer membrane protein insertion porin family